MGSTLSTNTEALGPRDLVFCGATLIDAPLADKLAAASAGGFRGITLWSHDYRRARAAGYSDADLRCMLDDHGVVLDGVDCLLNWLPGDVVPPMEFFQATEEELYQVADALGGRWINVAQAFGDRVDFDDAASRLGRICERAAQRNLLVTLEFIPWSGIADLSVAHRLIRACSAENARIALDAWHFFRGCNSLAELSAVPVALFDNLQLNDAPAAAAANLTEEAGERLLPGEGELPVRALVEALLGHGVRGPWGIEASASRWQQLSPEAVGRRCGAAMREILGLGPASGA